MKATPAAGTHGERVCGGVLGQRRDSRPNPGAGDAAASGLHRQRRRERTNGGAELCGLRGERNTVGNITQARSFLAAPNAACSHWTGGKRWAQKKKKNEATLAHEAPADALIGRAAHTPTEKKPNCFYAPCVTLGSSVYTAKYDKHDLFHFFSGLCIIYFCNNPHIY